VELHFLKFGRAHRRAGRSVALSNVDRSREVGNFLATARVVQVAAARAVEITPPPSERVARVELPHRRLSAGERFRRRLLRNLSLVAFGSLGAVELHMPPWVLQIAADISPTLVVLLMTVPTLVSLLMTICGITGLWRMLPDGARHNCPCGCRGRLH
jgi:hypothetical protein